MEKRQEERMAVVLHCMVADRWIVGTIVISLWRSCNVDCGGVTGNRGRHPGHAGQQ